MDSSPLFRKALLNLKVPLTLVILMANFSLAGAIKVNPHTGEIEDYLLGKPDNMFFITGAFQKDDKVYLSSLAFDKIAIVPI